MTNFELTPETTARDLYIFAHKTIGPLPKGPLLEAFAERAEVYELYCYARTVLEGPLPEGPLLDAFAERAGGYDLYLYASAVLKGPLPEGPLLDAFLERADEYDLRRHTKHLGPLPPKDPRKTL